MSNRPGFMMRIERRRRAATKLLASIVFAVWLVVLVTAAARVATKPEAQDIALIVASIACLFVVGRYS